MPRRLRLLVLLCLLVCLPACAADLLKPNDTVAVCGDSITEQKEYSVFIEDYLLMCKPRQDLRVAQFGWGGETAGGFLWRMNNDVLWLKPSVVTTCYGMNDGGYKPLEQSTIDNYRKNTLGIIHNFKQAGVRAIIIGSPGPVDTQTFRRNPQQAEMYNKTLAGLRDVARAVARQEGVIFADVYDPMYETMAKAKAKYGKAYPVCGGDGVHPSRNGQLIMTYAFLKAMGIDGDIGTITVDLGAGKATASDGHRILSDNAGTVEIESSRYPFCFQGKPADPNATTGIIEFLPFNQELNRLTLVVQNAPAGKVKVTWGKSTKEFASDELAKGINLAAEFAGDSPFDAAFFHTESVIRTQQNFETPLHKNLLHNLPVYRELLPETKSAVDQIVAAASARDLELFRASQAAVAPVKHTLKIEPVK